MEVLVRGVCPPGLKVLLMSAVCLWASLRKNNQALPSNKWRLSKLYLSKPCMRKLFTNHAYTYTMMIRPDQTDMAT